MQQLHDKDYGEDFFAPASPPERRRGRVCKRAARSRFVPVDGCDFHSRSRPLIRAQPSAKKIAPRIVRSANHGSNRSRITAARIIWRPRLAKQAEDRQASPAGNKVPLRGASTIDAARARAERSDSHKAWRADNAADAWEKDWGRAARERALRPSSSARISEMNQGFSRGAAIGRKPHLPIEPRLMRNVPSGRARERAGIIAHDIIAPFVPIVRTLDHDLGPRRRRRDEKPIGIDDLKRRDRLRQRADDRADAYARKVARDGRDRRAR